MKKLMVLFPADLHHRLKVYAVQQNITMRDFIIEVVAEALEKKGGKKPKG